MISQVNH